MPQFMFSYLSKDGKMALRLPPTDLEAFLKKYNAKLCASHGSAERICQGAGFSPRETRS